MNIINKDVAHIIGKYALPAVWKVEIALFSHQYDTSYIFAEDKEKIDHWLAQRKKDLIYNVVYDLMQCNLHYDLKVRELVKSIIDLGEARKEYYENAIEVIRGLDAAKCGIIIERLNAVNLY